MLKSFASKLRESFFLIFPITIAICVIALCFGINDINVFLVLSVSAILLILGMSLFLIGADTSMSELGQNIGATLSKSKKIWLMVLLSFAMGFVITFAEPDLMVLATQVKNFSTLSSVWLFILVVSLGVGMFLMLAILKLLFKWKLSTILIISYALIFILSFFVPQQFMPLSFDSGSVTTGPISVPFLVSFGLGLSAVRGGNNQDDSFGLIALCSTGPILSVMILSMFLGQNPSTGVGDTIVANAITMQNFGQSFLHYIKDVAIVIAPLIIIFLLFQIFAFKFPKQQVKRTIVGFILTYVGVVLFLTGIECGYMNLGLLLGETISNLSNNWISLPIGLVLGALAILAEPALQVLKKRVEDITGGVIKQKVILISMSVGVACAVSFAVLQALLGFNLLFVLLPVYIICLSLAVYNTKLFTAVAFDSGGVATGAMAVSFILPFVTGLSAENANGFGTVGLIAAFPILTMQILGMIYKIMLKRANNKEVEAKKSKVEIIEFDITSKFVEEKRFNATTKKSRKD